MGNQWTGLSLADRQQTDFGRRYDAMGITGFGKALLFGDKEMQGLPQCLLNVLGLL